MRQKHTYISENWITDEEFKTKIETSWLRYYRETYRDNRYGVSISNLYRDGRTRGVILIAFEEFERKLISAKSRSYPYDIYYARQRRRWSRYDHRYIFSDEERIRDLPSRKWKEYRKELTQETLRKRVWREHTKLRKDKAKSNYKRWNGLWKYEKSLKEQKKTKRLKQILKNKCIWELRCWDIV